MIKYFTNAFKITSENIILTTPLILFIIILGFYSGITRNISQNHFAIILFAVTALFMLSAFLAGWFFMIKKSIDIEKITFESSEEKAKASLKLLKEIPTGIGEYFIPFVFGLILYILFFFILIFGFYFVGLHFIGKIDINPIDLKTALSSSQGLKDFILTLPADKLNKLNAWYTLIFVLTVIYSFITMFWSAEIIISTKNPVKAFANSIVFIFKNILASLIIFAYINLINFVVPLVINIMVTLPVKIPFLNFIFSLVAMIIYFYFFVYVIVLVFLYYDRENNRQVKDKIKISGDTTKSIENNCDSGTDCDREEQSGNKDS